MIYAIQLSDLLVLKRNDPVIATFICAKLGRDAIVVDNQRFDGCALPLDCGAEQAAAIVAVLRTKYRRDQVRCYRRGATGGWKRV